MSRWQLFKGWYKKLREEGKQLQEFRKNQRVPLWEGGSYNMWNCFWWALHNSKTHDLDGEYLKKVGNNCDKNVTN